MDYRVKTPVSDYLGQVGKVAFANGEARCNDTDHAAELAYFRASGYAVEEVDESEKVGDDGASESEAPAKPPRKRAAKRAAKPAASPAAKSEESDS